jgi:hypothetical protein
MEPYHIKEHMKIYEWAKENDVSVKEAKEHFGATSHMALVPEAVEDDQTTCDKPTQDIEEVEVAQEVVEDVVVSSAPVPDTATIELSIRCLGNKSKHWNLRHLIGR